MTLFLPYRRPLLGVQFCRNELWRRARAVPSLDLRFAEDKSLVDAISGQNLVTFTRASSATYVDSQGVIQTASNNVPRFDHNPTTGESLGLLVEEQRTNGIRNSTMVGAVAGTPGTLPTNWGTTLAGLTQEIVGIGAENGINYIDIRFNGTATGTQINVFLETVTGNAIANGTAYTFGLYWRIVAGALTNISSTGLVTNGYDSGGAFLSGSFSLGSYVGSATPSSTLSRVSRTYTGTNASLAFGRPGLFFNVTTVGSTIDFTIRIGLPQFETGAFITSPIPTTGTAATRSASLADLISSAIANNIRSFYVEFRSPAVGTRGAASLNDNTANERAAVITSGADPRLVVHDGGVEQANINGGTVTANTPTRAAVRINENDFAISINGGAAVTDTSGTLPTVDRLMLGRTQAGEYLNGTIARFTGWTQELSNSTLQALAQ